MKKIVVLIFCANILCCFPNAQLPRLSNDPVIHIYNPSKSIAHAVVELATGNMATPGLLDWQNVHLEYDGKVIPFSIREGRAHWKSGLTSNITNPAPEDILVFTFPAPSQKWAQVRVVKGAIKNISAISRSNGNIIVTYPGLTINISERTGMLTRFTAFGESMLSEPMQAGFFKTDEGVIDKEGRMGPGYQVPFIKLKRLSNVPVPGVQLVSWSSNQALTEINFILKHADEIAVALTYRIYPNREMEIIIDERPWQGRSPWLSYGFENSISFSGTKKELPGFQNYYPYYGFKDYTVSVKSIGISHHTGKSILFELGEESINGRFSKRRLAVFSSGTLESEKDILDRLDEGLVIKTAPVTSASLPSKLRIVHSEETTAIAGLLTEALHQSGIGTGDGGFSILFTIQEKKSAQGIRGDGFRISPVKNGIEISAITKFGLFQGVKSFIQSLKFQGNTKTAPLISSNPVIDLRAGGFGGGPHEVDFPYGDEAEWKHAFDGMIASGMNSMTDLGMWSNWKMPVTFKYMPELQSTDPAAYDEVSGAKFSAFDSSRKFALKLINYLHDRGVKVWLWIPVGAVPTTFEEKFPEATVPGKRKVPRFTHPTYRKYLESYFRELLETYPIDGFVLIRDDNGGIDDTEEFKKYLEQSKTKDPVWEQYVVLNQLLRDLKFGGKVGIYPYFDVYIPKTEDVISEDFVIVGHGSGIAALSRDFENLGTMGDTWLDNLFGGFRIPSTGRMKRLLADRGSYWIGGAYYGMELSWESLGYFGWQPSASVNSFRYEFGKREFGEKSALDFMSFSDASDNLWEIMNERLLPGRWYGLSDNTRTGIINEGLKWSKEYRKRLTRLRNGYRGILQDKWFQHTQLYSTYFDYHLRRSALTDKIRNLVHQSIQPGIPLNPLTEAVKKQVLALNDSIYTLAIKYDRQAAGVHSDMIAQTRSNNFMAPYKEFVYGYEDVPDSLLPVKQFNASIKATITPVSAGQPFEIRIELVNTGFMPWIKDTGNELIIKGETKKLGLPEKWVFEGDQMTYGDSRTIILKGVAPVQTGKELIKIGFISPVSQRRALSEQSIELKW